MYLLLITFTVYVYYILRKTVTKYKIWSKQNSIKPVIQSDIEYNSASFNPEIMDFKMTFGYMLLLPALCFPAVWLYYFSNEQPNWSEFQFFLTDLSLHIAASIVMPCIVYGQNARLRSYAWQGIENYFEINVITFSRKRFYK